jgi:DNA-binding NarL/FixJ family response regulator
VPLKCLIVDDHEGFLASAAELLSLQGMTIVGCASSADEALRSADSLRPDVTLVDVELGDEDGIELAHRLTDAGTAGDVILISIRTRDELGDLIQDSGAVGFIHKDGLDVAAITNLIG